MPRHTQVPRLEVASAGNQGVESPDQPEAHRDQLDLHAAQGSQDIPLRSAATIERIRPVEELSGYTQATKVLLLQALGRLDLGPRISRRRERPRSPRWTAK